MIAPDHTFHNQNLSSLAWRDYNRLRDAVRCGDTNLTKNLIENGVLVNAYTDGYHENTPLHLAVISRSSELVNILLEHNADMDVKNAVFDTPLVMAARMGTTNIIDILLSVTVKLGRYSRDNVNHLHVACMRNRLDVVKRLVSLEHNDELIVRRNINTAVAQSSLFWSGFTPLHFAVYYSCVETTEYLLKCGVDIMIQDSKGLTPLHWADLQRNEKIIDLLLTAHKYEFKNPMGSHGLSHFHIACTRDNPLIVEHFLKLGVDINLKVTGSDESFWLGWQPIHLAMYYECPKVVRLLLRMNADYRSDGFHRQFYRRDSLGGCDIPLLRYAFITKNETIYKLFTEDEINTNESSKNIIRISDFHMACIDNDIEKINLLFPTNFLNRADLNTPLWNSYTALHLSVKYNAIDATMMLLAHGADIMVQDFHGKTPLHLAFEYGHEEIMDEIIKNFPEDTENLTDATGLSFLHILCSTNRIESVETFLSRGFDINASVGNESAPWAGFTPMHFACRFKQHRIVEFLRNYNVIIPIENGSIVDHFDLIFRDFEQLYYLSKLKNVLYENLLKILSSPPLRKKYSNYCGVSPLHMICMYVETDLKLVKQYVITHKTEINQIIEMPQLRKYHKCTPLHLAMRYRNIERAQVIMEAGADPLLVNGDGNTPLESAFSAGGVLGLSVKEAQMLFTPKTSLNNLKPSHFFIACASYLVQFVTDVLDNVNDVSVKRGLVSCRNDADETPLHYLSQRKYLDEDEVPVIVEIMKLLLIHGANANALDYQLQTPLFYVEDAEVMQLLIDHGAQVNIKNIHGETPIHIILRMFREWDHEIVITMLLENGAELNLKNRQGHTCLMAMNSFNGTDLIAQNVVPVLKHVMKLQLIGMNINEEDEDVYFRLLHRFHNSFNENTFKNECRNELESMKLTNIDNYTTLYDVLFKSPNKMSHHCENDVLQNMLESLCKDYPKYGCIVRLQMKKGKIRQPLLENAKRSLIVLVGKSLPPTCLDMIFDHLSNIDLEHISANE
ncbi:hypothetical protein QAD02_006218 [Eretmocerus hayati]|uniref:Uncharacterized protein n=1 Tax=Eretmocerus hayati TaxID=131215 RepID=A0ACC2N1F4_9HYME|nr:hypothetical protein QAD02_006218 [Eretmocerus hayati]